MQEAEGRTHLGFLLGGPTFVARLTCSPRRCRHTSACGGRPAGVNDSCFSCPVMLTATRAGAQHRRAHALGPLRRPRAIEEPARLPQLGVDKVLPRRRTRHDRGVISIAVFEKLEKQSACIRLPRWLPAVGSGRVERSRVFVVVHDALFIGRQNFRPTAYAARCSVTRRAQTASDRSS